MTKTVKNEVVKTLQKTRGVRHLEFVSDNELKAVISNRNTALVDEIQKAYIDLKLKGMVDNYKQNEYGTEVFITVNDHICDDPKFTKKEKKCFDLDILEYAFYKKELEGTDYETLMGDTPNPKELLDIIKNDIYINFENYPLTRDFLINFAIESLLKTYYYYNGTYDLFTTYKIHFFKKENENVDEFLKYADEIVEGTTNEKGEIKHKEKANLVIVTLVIALAQILRENNMSVFEEFIELI